MLFLIACVYVGISVGYYLKFELLREKRLGFSQSFLIAPLVIINLPMVMRSAVGSLGFQMAIQRVFKSLYAQGLLAGLAIQEGLSKAALEKYRAWVEGCLCSKVMFR